MSQFSLWSAEAALKACVILGICISAGFARADEFSLSKQDQANEGKALAAAMRKIDSLQPLTARDRAALKDAALHTKISTLRVCADPGDMPSSNQNGDGYENKIVDIIAADMGAQVSYYWLPYTERAFLRQTFGTGTGDNKCDVLLDMPIGYEGILLSEPIYKTTFVLASLADRHYHFKNFDDPLLKKLKIGVYQTSAIRQVLHQHGIDENVVVHPLSHDADLNPKDQPSYQIQQLIDGKIDVAAAWGPFAGYYKTVKKAPIVLQPANLMEDDFPLEFELGLGVRPGDYILKYKIDLMLEDKKAEIAKVLNDFGVPLVQCSDCTVAGDLPAHGEYAKPLPTPPSELKSPVTMQQLKGWLAAGANVNEEFNDAAVGGDINRMAFLLSKGADINKPDEQGATALDLASFARTPEVVKFLLDHHADVNVRDENGMTPLMQAVEQDDVATIKLLIAHGARLNDLGPEDATPLALAIVDNKMEAAMELINAGASVDAPSGKLGLTPLMIAGGRQQIQPSISPGGHEYQSLSLNPQYPTTLQIAQLLIQHKANVNAVGTTGLTALMLAAAHNNVPIVGLLIQSGADLDKKSLGDKTALDFAIQNGNDTVVSVIRLMHQSNGK